DESGAAGLAFHADGNDKHYGFYPTDGQLRLTRFDGPDVLSWKILAQEKSPHYHPGDWNTLRVRVEKDKLLCYVNDQLVIESTDTGLTGGQVGLWRFRARKAEFKTFQRGERAPSAGIPADVIARITRSVEKMPATGPLEPKTIDTLQPDGAAGVTVLRDR